MNKITAFKLVTRLVVGAGTTTISNSIIRNNVTPSNPLETVTVTAASFVIGSMVSAAAKNHTDTQIDGVVEAWNSFKHSDDAEPVTA